VAGHAPTDVRGDTPTDVRGHASLALPRQLDGQPEVAKPSLTSKQLKELGALAIVIALYKWLGKARPASPSQRHAKR
jgi:hypothetical protein